MGQGRDKICAGATYLMMATLNSELMLLFKIGGDCSNLRCVLIGE